MKRIIFLLVAVTALSACASNGQAVRTMIPEAESDCVGGVKGKTNTDLKYKKKDIAMKWKSDVGEDTEFRIRLKPSEEFMDAQVEIIGVSGTLPNGAGSTPYGWLDVKGNAKDLKKAGKKAVLVVCVPEDVPVGTEYKFDVKIDGIGTLDPRAEVTW